MSHANGLASLPPFKNEPYADFSLPKNREGMREAVAAVREQLGRTYDLLIAGAEARSVRACVETLEGGQKQAIAMAFFQGLTHAELARQLRQPLGTVKSWVRRGLERLKQCLERGGYVR